MSVSDLFDLLILALLITCVLGIARVRDLATAVTLFAIYSFVLCLLWAHRGAPDVAMTEAAVGAGITAVLFFTAIAKIGRREK
ncbi:MULTISPECIES: hydrogenase subunit MbhD domain-containing protein [unclassified Wenzhouxiangella]|uniref:Na(+)/H(+) antiporter subunit B n=1 Tax=unclassified Wenzhouxiangella TaxID=2613841 RepID=UPI000E329967|nr:MULTISPECIES: hydrogenase subunit MbhD domain-containing protein [unclassified Wenzhouxiangella]RFF28029.1 DUF4040 domain-containing protein [Wenzhouxiangella sp. 15181]RFP68615.1 DUF4040 domain-containing protein [Wenzhouxiangella sp. 15190]